MTKEHECGPGCDHEDSTKELQRKFQEMQVMAQHHGQMQKHVEQVGSQLQEVGSVITSLRDIKEVKVGTELLIPVTNGIFANATLTNNSKLMMNVGGGSVVEKTVDEAIDMLRKQESELLVYQTQLSAQVQAFESRLADLQSDIQKMSV